MYGAIKENGECYWTDDKDLALESFAKWHARIKQATELIDESPGVFFTAIKRSKTFGAQFERAIDEGIL